MAPWRSSPVARAASGRRPPRCSPNEVHGSRCSTATPPACRAGTSAWRATSRTPRRWMRRWPRSSSTSARSTSSINNAGIGAAGDIAANDDDEWHRVLDVNVVGIARVTRAALPHLRQSDHARDRQHLLDRRHRRPAEPSALFREQGRGRRPDPGDGRRPRDARASGSTRSRPERPIPPGSGRLLDAADDRDAAAAALRARQPMGRLVTADEVAHAIAYLASPNASSTTGTLLGVDGGMQGLRVS